MVTRVSDHQTDHLPRNFFPSLTSLGTGNWIGFELYSPPFAGGEEKKTILSRHYLFPSRACRNERIIRQKRRSRRLSLSVFHPKARKREKDRCCMDRIGSFLFRFLFLFIPVLGCSFSSFCFLLSSYPAGIEDALPSSVLRSSLSRSGPTRLPSLLPPPSSSPSVRLSDHFFRLRDCQMNGN